MHPILFQWGEAALQTYSLAAALAYFVALGVWLHEGRRAGIAGEKIVHLSLMCCIIGWLAARAFYVLIQWRHFVAEPAKIVAFWEGGVVFLGGFLAAGAWLYYAFERHGIERAAGFNSFAPAMAFAHATGRIGCFFNGCCYGRACDLPWGLSYHDPLAAARPLDVPLHPTQLYEAAGLCALGALLLWNNRRKKPAPSALLYLFLYGILRFLVEFFRGDTLRGSAGPFSTSQWLSLSLIAAALTLDFYRRRGNNFAHENRNRKPQGAL